jgi:hypothetical protein
MSYEGEEVLIKWGEQYTSRHLCYRFVGPERACRPILRISPLTMAIHRSIMKLC